MIRPSSLSIAKFCALAPVLSERYPTRNAGTDRGNAVDAQVTASLVSGAEPADADARACVEWFREQFPAPRYRIACQKRVTLRDPDTGAIITEGTADVLVHDTQDPVDYVVDLKKREQYDAGRLADPDENLQLHAYALASTAEGRSYQTYLLLFGSGRAEPIPSKIYTAETWAPILTRIQEINERTGEPRGESGEHCGQCYPRIHCPQWALRAYRGLERNDVAFNDNNGADLLLEAKAMEERAARIRELAKHKVDTDGKGIRVGSQEYRRIMMSGQMTVDTAALERDGLYERYARVGRGFASYKLCRPRGK